MLQGKIDFAAREQDLLVRLRRELGFKRTAPKRPPLSPSHLPGIRRTTYAIYGRLPKADNGAYDGGRCAI